MKKHRKVVEGKVGETKKAFERYEADLRCVNKELLQYRTNV